MRFANVTTFPGRGYPRDWETKGGGFQNGLPRPGTLPNLKDCGGAWTFNHTEVTREGAHRRAHLKPIDASGDEPDWGYNWDEEVGGGDWPNPYYLNLPRKCNHCSNPPCVHACPRGAIYKRETDGIVLIDQARCHGHRFCVEACPYKAIYFNLETRRSEKCIECFPRVDLKIAPSCNRQCPGRARHYGYLDDRDGNVHKLVEKWRVALPLHPEYGTSPNVFYVPPLSPRAFDGEGRITSEMRIPEQELESLFGPTVREALETIQAEIRKRRAGEESELIDLLILNTWEEAFGEFTNEPTAQS
jgi:ethylbenzene hydroxylase subunit beta/complex iron-sulfur molybdoenzyme family reductase subunit beta